MKLETQIISQVFAATDTGDFFRFPQDSETSHEVLESIQLGQDLLCAFKVNPADPHLFATGGDERDLCIWDMTKLDPETEKQEPVWMAKNVCNPV